MRDNSEEADIADDIGAYVVVEFLGDAFVLHHQVLPERGTRELDMQFAFANEDLFGIAIDHFAHHFGSCLRDAILEQRRLQAFLTQKSQQNVL